MSVGTVATSYRRDMRLLRTNGTRVWAVVLTAALLYLPWVVSHRSFLGLDLTRHMLLNMNMTQLNVTLIVLVGALGLNLLTGYTGLISIGNAGFFALGAIVAASLGVKWVQAPFLVVVLAAGCAGAVVGAIVGLPSLRIRGIYLLLATMGLHFVMVFLFLKFTTRWFGFGGIQFTPTAHAFGIPLNTDIRWYYFLLVTAGIALLLTRNLLRSRRGRAFVAVRDHPIAASMSGINVARTRVTSFAISSFMVTAIGAVYVWYLGAASQDNFTLLFAIQFIAMIVIGGEGSLVGTALGALVWSIIPTALIAFSEMAGGISPGLNENVLKWQTQYTNIIFGVLIVLVMIFNPTGLAGLWARLKRAFVRWPYTT